MAVASEAAPTLEQGLKIAGWWVRKQGPHIGHRIERARGRLDQLIGRN